MSIKISRFKDKNGREGISAPIGNGLIKRIYDDGGMAILKDLSYRAEVIPGNESNAFPHLDCAIEGRETMLTTPRHRVQDLYPSANRIYPLISIPEIPMVVEQLIHGQGHPRFAALMFVPNDSKDGESANLQFSMENGVLGLEWMLHGRWNTEDQAAVTEIANGHRHQFRERELNEVQFLRIEGPELAKWGMRVISEFYLLDPNTKIQLFAEGFEWLRAPESP